MGGGGGGGGGGGTIRGPKNSSMKWSDQQQNILNAINFAFCFTGLLCPECLMGPSNPG